jgi:hypothetical protein
MSSAGERTDCRGSDGRLAAVDPQAERQTGNLDDPVSRFVLARNVLG